MTLDPANLALMKPTQVPHLVLCEIESTNVAEQESYSPFCLKAHRALRAAGLAYQSRHADRPAAHQALNTTGQVPVLLVGEKAIPDSTAILRAIVDDLAPGSLVATPEAWLWEELADTSLNGFVVAARWADEENWPRVREAYFGRMPAPIKAVVPAMLRRRVLKNLVARDVWRAGEVACWSRFERLLDQLDSRAPERGFWLGDALSVADLGLFAQLHALRIDSSERCARSFRRTAETGDALMPVRLTCAEVPTARSARAVRRLTPSLAPIAAPIARARDGTQRRGMPEGSKCSRFWGSHRSSVGLDSEASSTAWPVWPSPSPPAPSLTRLFVLSVLKIVAVIQDAATVRLVFELDPAIFDGTERRFASAGVAEIAAHHPGVTVGCAVDPW